MTRAGSLGATVVAVLVAALFVWTTGQTLPAVVASHFDATGVATGFAPRHGYLVLMTAVVVGVPALVVVGTSIAARSDAGLKLPNAGYWLAPERRERTVDALGARLHLFAAAFATFMAYLHWLVLRANAARPPRLSNAGIYGGLVVFGIFTIAWSLSLGRRFRLP